MKFPSSIKLALAGLVALGTVTVATPAFAEGEPPTDQQHRIASVSTPQNPSENLVLGLAVVLEQQDGSAPVAGIEVRVDTYSCGNFLKGATGTMSSDQKGVAVWFSPDGKPSATKNAVNAQVGPSVEYVVTIVQPGYNAYVLEGSYSGYEVRRPSCDQINDGTDPGPGPDSCSVTRWSSKKPLAATGTGAFAGEKVAVRPTKTNCSVHYSWVLGGKVVKQSRSYFIPVRAKGKTLSMRVVVTKSGVQPLMKTIKYGRVR